MPTAGLSTAHSSSHLVQAGVDVQEASVLALKRVGPVEDEAGGRAEGAARAVAQVDHVQARAVLGPPVHEDRVC